MPQPYPLPLLVFTTMIWVLTPSVYADYQPGLEAYNQGDYSTALKEWQSLADEGNREAQLGLPLLYLFGQGVAQDKNKALRLMRLSAEQGYAGAQIKLRLGYSMGSFGAPDKKEAEHWLKLAAEQGEDLAQEHLASLYLKGERKSSSSE